MNKEQKKKRNISTLLFAMQLIRENTHKDITQSKCRVEIDNITTIKVMSQHNERDGDSNHRRLDCLCNHLFRRRLKKASKPRVIGLSEGNSTVTGEVPAQRASNVENVSIWWRHRDNSVSCIVWHQLSSCAGAGVGYIIKTALETTKAFRRQMYAITVLIIHRFKWEANVYPCLHKEVN